LSSKKNKFVLDMETIDSEDALTLQILLLEESGFSKIGEIQINILELITNKSKKYLIGDEVSIEFKTKFETSK
jgi:hypothetical protein